jgi:hypothetical protein
MAAGNAPETNFIVLNRPGRIIEVVEQCCLRRIAPNRSGWSTARHLGLDLHRLFGVHVPQTALDRALRELVKRERLRQRVDERGVVWYRAT